MVLSISPPAAAFLVLLLATGCALGQAESVESTCDMAIYSSVRSAWASEYDPCHQKLPLDMWTFMKWQGSAKDADAEHVYVACLRQPQIGLVELITPKDWNSDIVSGASGEILGESENAASFLIKGADDFEAICQDDQVTKATRVVPITASSAPLRRNRRGLQTTTSEAVVAHQVEELIQSLADLSCTRTRGEDQTICIMGDSFNRHGAAARLHRGGDIPYVWTIKERPGDGPTDEGSAMVELAFDIASGSTYKFNTAALGEQTFADDIAVLAGREECDIIVDDIGYPEEPSFRDGVVATAIDAATQDHDVLFFSSAGNDGVGHRFASSWVCQPDLWYGITVAPCSIGVSAHIFDPSDPTLFRWFFQFTSTLESEVMIKWDDAEGYASEVTIIIWLDTSETTFAPVEWGRGTSAAGSASAFVKTPGTNQRCYISLHRFGGERLEGVDMHLVSLGGEFDDSTIAMSGGMYGHSCATNALSVAAIPYSSASGAEGAFADPEPASVEEFSSRGPCLVDGGRGLTTRNHPVTTAADELQTSTEGFEMFGGTSAASPVAAAIAAIIRAACFPRVVTYSDMMEMLTDYQYTIDATSDAGGAAETFGAEAGNGIISAQQMSRWVAENCAEACPATNATVQGDPHLVGLAGQKFDFTGHSNSWYALLSAWGTEHVNMRVTAPIADLPRITYITGISVQAADEDGVDHSIVIFVNDPSILYTSCPEDGMPCIGDGALTVLLDGERVVSPGAKELGPGVSFVAANIPGVCRPFGFERYWQQKVPEAELLTAQSGRLLSTAPTMDRWIADDASATNPTKCKEYVFDAVQHGRLFTHQSDHVSFQLVTPNLTLRLNHGKLHQLPKRDPTDTFDIPDHHTYQMNLGFLGIKRDDTMQGIIGETSVPTVDEHGAKIMSGLEAVRGQEEDYKVDGALGKTFNQLTAGVY